MSILGFPSASPFDAPIPVYEVPNDEVSLAERLARTVRDASSYYSPLTSEVLIPTFNSEDDFARFELGQTPTVGSDVLSPLDWSASERTASEKGRVIGGTILGGPLAMVTHVAAKIGDLVGRLLGIPAGLICGIASYVASKIRDEDFSLDDFRKRFMDAINEFSMAGQTFCACIPGMITDMVITVGAAIGWGIGKPIEMYQARQLPAVSAAA